MSHKALIEKFYTAFQNRDAATMAECYHKDVEFEDPAFGRLKGDEVKSMWKMLLSREGTELKIEFNSVEADEKSGSANWIAHYKFGPQKRPVINKISARFEFKDGLIYRHKDSFSMWTWSRQALGTTGLLLGWSGFVKNKVQSNTNQALEKYMKDNA